MCPSVSMGVCPNLTDCVEKVAAVVATVCVRCLLRGRIAPPYAGCGTGMGMSFASFLRFWAVAARWNSSRAPDGPRNRSRSRRKMRFKCANSISTFFRRFRDVRFLGLGDVAGHIPRSLVDRPRDLAGRRLGAAARLESAHVAIVIGSAIDERRPVVHRRTRASERLARRTEVGIPVVIVGEVLARQGAVGSGRLVQHRYVRLDAVFVDQPAEHLGRPVGGVAGKPRRVEIEALHRPLDHGLRRRHLGVADGGGGLDIDDDRIVDVDEIVGGVGEEGLAAMGAGPSCGRIGRRDELRRDRRSGAEGGIVEHRQVLSCRSAYRLAC